MKIAIILGSVRKGRQSYNAAHYLEKTLVKRGIETDLIDLSLDSLPILGDASITDAHLPNKIQEMSSRLKKADALIFVTPEYHGSFSGVIKNVLDYFWAEFSKKPIGVAAVSTGKMGGINASTQLQHVILSLGAFPLPVKLLFPEIHLSFNTSFEPQNEKVVKSTEKFINEYLWFAEAIHHKKSREILEKAE